MKITYFCLLIAGLMPILCTAIAKWGFKDFDNHNPRHWLSVQTGFRARANAAQANSFEAFPLFAVSVICALGAQSELDLLAGLCLLFIGFRLFYIFAYITDRARFRTLMWVAALGCVIGNFALAISAIT